MCVSEFFQKALCVVKRVQFSDIHQSKVGFKIPFDGDLTAEREVEVHDRKLVRGSHHIGEQSRIEQVDSAESI